jgi:hypothetical protein
MASRGAIMTEFVVLIPAVISLWYVRTKSYQQAFLTVYLFTVLVLPGWCRLNLPSIPKVSFDEAAILPVLFAWIVDRNRGWKFSWFDLLVFGLIATMGYSEYVNEGFPAMRNQSVDLILGSVVPYALGKCIQAQGLTVRFARKFVWYLSLVFITTLYEARFAYSPYRLVFGWVTTFRYGMPRVAGPFGHAILAGLIFMIALSLQLWLADSGLWEARFKRSFFGLKKATVLTAVMAGGLFLTFVRGPQIGMGLSLLLRWAGRGTKPKKRMLWLLAGALAIGIPLGLWFSAYVSVSRSAVLSQSQESAVYRKELLDKYQASAIQHGALGWGINGWPKVNGMPSIDNYYLLLSLMHGFIASGLLLCMLLVMPFRLLRNGLRYAPLRPLGSSLSFTLLGIYVGILFSLATVYIGGNVLPVFYLLVGFTEGYLRAGGDRTLQASKAANTVILPLRQQRLPRIVA